MRLLQLTLLILLLLMTGCQSKTMLLGDPETPYPPVREPLVGDILHLPTGIYVTAAAMYDQASRAQVVYVGETHDNPASHRLQGDILQALAASNPGEISLAMEMFTPKQQPGLDRWVAGDLTEKEFLKEVDWSTNWRMNFALYRDLLTFCRDRQIPILALNADKDLQKQVSRTPFAELTTEEQQLLPELDHSDPYQRAMVEAVFSDHKMGQTMLDGFQRVQTLWDETMAQNLADYLKKVAPDHQVMVVAGGNHVRYGYGIPRRLFRRLPVSYLLIGSVEIDVPEDKQDRLMNIIKPDYPMPPYHFVTFTEYEDLPNPGVKLGIMLDKADGGLVVKGVVPGSVAEKAGILKDDLLTRMDNIELKEPFDLIYELQQRTIGAKISLTLLRGEETLALPIEFTEAEPKHQNMGMKQGQN